MKWEVKYLKPYEELTGDKQQGLGRDKYIISKGGNVTIEFKRD